VGGASDNTVNPVPNLDTVCKGGAMKATITKYFELSWDQLIKMKAFLSWSTFCKFDPSELTTPSLRIATATNEQGEATVFCPIETVMLVSYALNPKSSQNEAFRAGNAVDAEIARLGQQLGISKAMIVLPEGVTIPDDEGETIRVHIRNIPQSVVMGLRTDTPLQSARYVN
jgi:hypothetical protein